MAVKNRSTIQFNVGMDENSIPEEISWSAEGSEKGGTQEAKGMMIALYDEKEENTLRIDLWKKDMMVEEMMKFTCQNIITLADSFARATGEEAYAEEIREFGKSIAVKMGVLGPKK
ncbi:gliding motility protein GldC [Vicingaceae bacterium]|jgi:gliding motility-associated protein GldC|nr:gliding motility protein GldC [Vicingaceae bacterium]